MIPWLPLDPGSSSFRLEGCSAAGCSVVDCARCLGRSAGHSVESPVGYSDGCAAGCSVGFALGCSDGCVAGFLEFLDFGCLVGFAAVVVVGSSSAGPLVVSTLVRVPRPVSS